jgi:hypothetical protein
MDFHQAIDLAKRIAHTLPSWRIIAIGRFVPVELLDDSHPWMISLIPRGSTEKRMIRSTADLESIIEDVFGPQVAEVTPPGCLF